MKRIALVAMVLCWRRGHEPAAAGGPSRSDKSEKAESFSPLGFEDLRAYQQAFPGTPGSLAVVRAAASNWIFVASPIATRRRDKGPHDEPRPAHQRPGARVRKLRTYPGGSRPWRSRRRARSRSVPPVGRHGRRRRVAKRRRDAYDDVRWRWIGQGLGTNNIGSLALDPNDERRDHLRRHRRNQLATARRSATACIDRLTPAITGHASPRTSWIPWCRRDPSISPRRAESAAWSSSPETRRPSTSPRPPPCSA
jgi:hypothetical protein